MKIIFYYRFRSYFIIRVYFLLPFILCQCAKNFETNSIISFSNDKFCSTVSPLYSEDLIFGSDTTLDIITWNIETFPKNEQTTTCYVAKLLQTIDMDVLAIQEIDDTEIFVEMVSQLNGFSSHYESNWFAGLGYIYKTNLVEINNIYEIFETSQYWNTFPRSPLVMDMNFMGQQYFIINNHFKCCGDGILDINDNSDEENRRYNAINLLKEYVDTNLSNKNVIILGDFNDDLADAEPNNVFEKILNDKDHYFFVDFDIANSSSSEWSFPSWPSHLDHILISDELFSAFSSDNIETIKIDNYLQSGWIEYDNNISDHRPVGINLKVIYKK